MSRSTVYMSIGFGWLVLEVIVIVSSPLWCTGCSDASFEIAALQQGDTGNGSDSEVSTEEADALRVDSDNRHDGATSEGGEVDPSESEPDGDDSGRIDAVGDDRGVDVAEAFADADAGCPLYGHDDPLSSTSYDSCLPTGVPGDGSTYSKALLDGEIAHAAEKTPWITWGSASDLSCDSQTCEVHSLTVDAGVAFGIWCSTGPAAGWFIETGVGVPAMCPTSSVHGIWK